GKFGLRVEGIDVRHAAVHEQKDHMFGARREVGLLDSRLGPCPLVRQTGKGQPAEAHVGAAQEVAAGEGGPLAAGAESARPVPTTNASAGDETPFTSRATGLPSARE